MVQCPACESYNQPEALYCNQCGATLEPTKRRRRRRRSSVLWVSGLSVILCALIGLVVYVSLLPDHPGREARGSSWGGRKSSAQRKGSRPVRSRTPPGQPGAGSDEPVEEPRVIDVGGARRSIERAMAVLKLQGDEGQPLRDVRGVVVHPEGTVLCRLTFLLGASQGTCRLASGRTVSVVGTTYFDMLLDLALVSIDGGQGELDFLPLLGEPSGVFEGGDPVFVLSGERVKEATISEPYFVTADGVVGLRLAREPPALADTFLAIGEYGYLVGLCRTVVDGRLVEAETQRDDRPYRVLIVPAYTLAPFLEGRRVVTTLQELTAQLYAGTFADLEERGRRAYREKRWAAALDLLSRALDRGTQEGLPDERLEEVSRELRESFFEEIRRLRSASRWLEAAEMTETGLGQFPDDSALWLQLAEIRLALGLNRESIGALLELRQLEPGKRVDGLLETSYLRLASEAARGGDTRYLESVYLEALDRLPRSAPLHIELAKLYRDWGAYDDALRLLQAARELDPALAVQVDAYIEKINDALARRDAVVIPLAQDSNSIRTTAVIDGREQFPFIIDTGATYTAVPERVVKGLGYNPDLGELLRVKTAGGSLLVRVVHLESISLEGYTVRNLKAIVLPDNIGPNVGLLGLNFLRFFKYGVDSSRREFRLERQ